MFCNSYSDHTTQNDRNSFEIKNSKRPRLPNSVRAYTHLIISIRRGTQIAVHIWHFQTASSRNVCVCVFLYVKYIYIYIFRRVHSIYSENAQNIIHSSSHSFVLFQTNFRVGRSAIKHIHRCEKKNWILIFSSHGNCRASWLVVFEQSRLSHLSNNKERTWVFVLHKSDE